MKKFRAFRSSSPKKKPCTGLNTHIFVSYHVSCSDGISCRLCKSYGDKQLTLALEFECYAQEKQKVINNENRKEMRQENLKETILSYFIPHTHTETKEISFRRTQKKTILTSMKQYLELQ